MKALKHLVVASSLISIFANAQTAENTSTETAGKDPQYSRPLPFDVVERELKIKNVLLQYDLQSSKGKELKIGKLTFNSQSFNATLENEVLSLKWDKRFVKSGEITVISQQGKELWKASATGVGESSHKGITATKGPQWKSGEGFRFCLREEVGKGYSSICSSWYGVEVQGESVQLGHRRSQATPRVIFQNEERKTVGSEVVTLDTPVQFFASLDSDTIYEFVSEPVALQITDMATDAKADHVVLSGVVPAPLNFESKVTPGNQYGVVTRVIGFQNTISAEPDSWQAEVPVKNLQLDLPGKAGGIFSYQLEISNPPKEKERRFISEKALRGTYLSKETMKVSDKDGVVTDWNFEVPNQFKNNRVTLEVLGEKENHQSYLDIYRGASGEASLRLTGVVTSQSDTVIMAEGHVSWWFNDLFGWQNYWLSKQRWGVSAKYFSSMNKISAAGGSTEESVNLQVADVDLRYRFNPGLWERDETVGAILAYESLTLGELSLPKIGAGLFWARSMPKVFDDLLSKIPFMNHPKWVDMELISYVMSNDSSYKLKGEYVLNFHGKVLWTPRFFGEAGFGLKNYHFEKESDGSGAKLTTFYGTVGLGLNF